MAKVPSITAREAIAALGKADFVAVRQKGSHVIMKKEGHRHVLTIPNHGSRDLRRGTLRSIINASGLTVAEFVDLL